MREYWDAAARENAAWYVDTSLAYDSPEMERFWETGRTIASIALESSPVQPPSHGLAVEIGPGLGRVCLALADRFDRVVGIDISEEMVERARSLVVNDKVRFEVGDGSTISSIADSSADLVVTFTVFQHIPVVAVIERYIQDVGRALRAGGVFSFQWNNLPGSTRWALRRDVRAALRRIGLGRRDGTNDPAFQGSRVPIDTIRAAVDRAGMDLQHIERPGELFTWAWAVKR
jgi:SAM-dependent methyltransferase